MEDDREEDEREETSPLSPLSNESTPPRFYFLRRPTSTSVSSSSDSETQTQSKLLREAQDRVILCTQGLGPCDQESFDMVTADIEQALESGEFKPDLLWDVWAANLGETTNEQAQPVAAMPNMSMSDGAVVQPPLADAVEVNAESRQQDERQNENRNPTIEPPKMFRTKLAGLKTRLSVLFRGENPAPRVDAEMILPDRTRRRD